MLFLRITAVLFSLAALSSSLLADGQQGKRERPSFRFSGFSDVVFKASDESDPDASSEFQEGQFVLHVVSDISSRIDFFAELSLTARDSEFSTEVERSIIKFTYNDFLKASLGRFHTPVNWWNTAFHHGQWLQTTISRPAMTRFGGEFIPVHFVGGILEGSLPSGPAHLGYVFGVGNGRSENIARGGDAGDVNNNRAVLLKLFSRPSRPFRLEVGGSYYLDKISRDGFEDLDEALASLYLAWSGETPEVIGEWARIEREGETSGTSFDSSAWYLQVAYRLPFLESLFKPYTRYEKIDVADGEPVFTTQTDSEGYLIGLRADVASFVALKGEWRHQQTSGNPYDDVYFFQVSFAF